MTEELLKTYDVMMIGYIDRASGSFQMVPNDDFNEEMILDNQDSSESNWLFKIIPMQDWEMQKKI